VAALHLHENKEKCRRQRKKEFFLDTFRFPTDILVITFPHFHVGGDDLSIKNVLCSLVYCCSGYLFRKKMSAHA